jgi:hypothetical protein
VNLYPPFARGSFSFLKSTTAFFQNNKDLMMHRQVKRSGLLRISSLIMLFATLLGGFVLVYDQTKPAGKDARAPDSNLINEIIPGLSGVSYSSYANNQQDLTFKAKRIFLRNRQFDGHILNFCKDIVISGLQVRVKSPQLERVMDWAYNSHLKSISSALFFDYRLLIYKKMSNINIRFVVQPLQVDLIPNNGELPIFSIHADSMFKESTSDDLTFEGNVRLFLNDREFINSQLAKWDLDRHRFLFPVGFVMHGSFYPNSLAVGSNAYVTIAEIKDLLAENKPRQTFTKGPSFAKKIDLMGRNKDGIPASIDLERISRNLKKLDRKTQKMVVLEMLATNPGVFKQVGLSPASLLLFPNFQLGAFEPGPFFAGF